MTTTVYDQVWLLWHMFLKLRFMNQFFAKRRSQQVFLNILYSKYKKQIERNDKLSSTRKQKGKYMNIITENRLIPEAVNNDHNVFR
jgi:hypothetical protein